MAGRTLRDKDGRYAGMLGAGKEPPSTGDSPAARAATRPRRTSAPGPSPDVDTAYATFQGTRPAPEESGTANGEANTFPQRLADMIRAQAALSEAETAREVALAAAGGRAIHDSQCAECSHPMHDRACGNAIQVMSDVYESCRCAAGVAPTREQVAAAMAGRAANTAYREWSDARDAAEEFRTGDPLVVARGRKVAPGTTGVAVRTFTGDYGPRVLLRTPGGSDIWVTAANLDRLSVRDEQQAV